MGSIDKEIQLDSMVFIRDYGFRRCFTPEYQSGTTSQTAAQFVTTASEGASRLVRLKRIRMIRRMSELPLRIILILELPLRIILILLRCRINVSKEKTLDTCEAGM